MAVYNKYANGVDALVKAINAATDSFKICLTNTVTPATDTVYSSGYDLATGNGYTNGGNAATTSSSSTSGGVFKLILNSPATWTATGSVGPFRYAVLYDTTTTNLLGYWDFGSSITLNNGDTFTVTLDGTNGVFQVS